MNWAFYDEVTGEILSQAGSSLIDTLPTPPSGEDVVETFEILSPDDWYVDSGVVTARPELTATFDDIDIPADGVTEATLSTLPTGTIIEVLPDLGTGIAAQEVTVNDGEFVFTSTKPGTMRFMAIPPFPYKMKLYEVTVS